MVLKVTDFMPFLTPSWWFWLWFSFKVTIADLIDIPTRIATGVPHATHWIYVTDAGLPPMAPRALLAA